MKQSINQLFKPGKCGEARDKEVVALQGQPPLRSAVFLSEKVFIVIIVSNVNISFTLILPERLHSGRPVGH